MSFFNPLSVSYLSGDAQPVPVLQDVFFSLDSAPVSKKFQRITPISEPEAVTVHTKAELRDQAIRVARQSVSRPGHYKIHAEAGLGKTIVFPNQLATTTRGVVIVLQPNDILVATSYDGAVACTNGSKAAVFSDKFSKGSSGGVVYMTACIFLKMMLQTKGLRQNVRAIVCDESHHDDGLYMALKAVLSRMIDITVVYLTATGAVSQVSSVDQHITVYERNFTSADDILTTLDTDLKLRHLVRNNKPDMTKSIVFLPDVSQHEIMLRHYREHNVPCVSFRKGMTAEEARNACAALTSDTYAIVSDDIGSSGINFDVEIVIDTTVKSKVAYSESTGRMSIETIPVSVSENLQRRWRTGRFSGIKGHYVGSTTAAPDSKVADLLINDIVVCQMILRAFDIVYDQEPWSRYLSDFSVDFMRECVLCGFVGLLSLYVLAKYGLTLKVRSCLSSLRWPVPDCIATVFPGDHLDEFRRIAVHDSIAFRWLDRLDDDKTPIAAVSTMSKGRPVNAAPSDTERPLQVDQSDGAKMERRDDAPHSMPAPLIKFRVNGDSGSSSRRSSSSGSQSSQSVQSVSLKPIPSSDKRLAIVRKFADFQGDVVDKFSEYGFVPSSVLSDETNAQGVFQHKDAIFCLAGREYFQVDRHNLMLSESFTALAYNIMTRLHTEYNPPDENHVPNLPHCVARGRLKHIDYDETSFSRADTELINAVSTKGTHALLVSDHPFDQLFEPLDDLFGALVRARNRYSLAVYGLVTTSITDVARQQIKQFLKDLLTIRALYDNYLRNNDRYAVIYANAFSRVRITRQVLR